MNNVLIFEHPLIQHKVGIIRDETTTHKLFRELVNEIAMLMTYEVTRDMELVDKEINTPICKATIKELKDDKVSIVPILRAGLGMVDGVLAIMPNAKVGHVGMYRDPVSHEPVPYYAKLPEHSEDRPTIVVDPMLATAGSAIATIDYLKKQNVKCIKFMCIVASQYGIDALTKAHPDVQIYAAACDEKLNENKYIVPGLGDAGDRLFGTK